MLVQARARLRYVSIPPRKMRLVAGTIKGMPVEKALNMLNFIPRIAAHHIAKTLKSAAANALSLEGTDSLKPEDLVITNIYVDAAPTAKRIRFQSMGRVFRYRKRYCHLTVELEGETEVVETRKLRRPRRKAADQESQAETETAKKDRKPRARKATKKTAAEVTEEAPASSKAGDEGDRGHAKVTPETAAGDPEAAAEPETTEKTAEESATTTESAEDDDSDREQKN